MALRPALGLGQRQRLALTPGLRLGLGLLRLPAADLAEAAARLAAENPFVVVLPPLQGGAPPAAAQQEPAARPGPLEGLLGQIAAMPLAPPVRAAAAYLAGCLDDRGYLDGALDELADAAGLAPGQAAAALAALQACEPAGVGARDLAECLALQLVDRGWPGPRAAALVARLDLVAKGDAAALGRALGLAPAAAAAAIAAIRGLAPHPFDAGAPALPLVPDLAAERAPGGGWSVRLVRGGIGRLRLDRALAAQAAAQGFAADRRAEAEAFLAALRFRGRTLLRIGRALARHQHAALDGGEAALRPLTRAALAGALGLHPSTVGRAVAGKAMLAEGRLWPLATFFSAALPAAAETGAAAGAAAATSDAGRSVAGAAVRQMIARAIAEEPAEARLSDAALVARLHAAGVDIARRTVAKYRQGMRIPSAAGRARRRPAGSGPGSGRPAGG